MGRVSASLQLGAPVATVFRVATRVEDLRRWLPEVADAQLLDPAMAPGSRIRLRMSPATGNAEVVGTVKALQAPELLAIAGSAGPLSLEVRTRFAADGPAATRIDLEIEIGSPPFLGFIAKEAERRIGAELEPSLERLRALVLAEPDAG